VVTVTKVAWHGWIGADAEGTKVSDTTTTPGQGTVVFVCPHGAGKSRIAAAWFNSLAPPGWWATSAGITPQPSVSVHAPRLLAGTPAEALLDRDLPRPLTAVGNPTLVVAIDCQPGEVPGALAWTLTAQAFDAELGAELRRRVLGLAGSLAARSGGAQ
jgi:hypothetical protein